PFQVLPIRAAVGGLVKSASGASADHAVGGAADLIHRGKHHLRILGIHHQIGGAGLVINIENFLPSRATIGGVEYAPLAVRTERMSNCSHINIIRVRGIHKDGGDVLRVAQTDVRPRFARVGGFVNAVAKSDIIAQTLLARSHVDDV